MAEHRARHALVTFLIGDAYVDAFERYVRPTWTPYAERHGYDIATLTEPIDPTCDFETKAIHWQKLLIGMHPDLSGYEKLVWVDSDILINHRWAPCIASAHDGPGIGVVKPPPASPSLGGAEFGHSTAFTLLEQMRRRSLSPGPHNDAAVLHDGYRAYYRLHGLDGPADAMINTGVLVFDPARHARTLAEIYLKYQKNYIDYEMTPLSFELQVRGLDDDLDPRFNAPWGNWVVRHYPFLFNLHLMRSHPDLVWQCVNTAFHNTWFLHFAGTRRHPVTKGPMILVDPACPDPHERVFPQYRSFWRDWFEFVDAEAFAARHAERRAGRPIDILF